MKRIKLYLSAFIVVASFLSLAAEPVFAVDGKFDYNYYSQNGVTMYSPTSTSCTDSGTDTYTGVTKVDNLVDSPALKNIYTLLTANTDNPINGIQAAAIMGNMFGESGLNPTAQEKDGPGYGLAQWSTAGRKKGLADYAAAKGTDISDPSTQVGYLLKEYNSSYITPFKGTDFENATDISKATKSWMLIFEAPLEITGSDPSALNSKRIPAAIKIYGFYKDTSTAGTVASKTNCADGDGVVAGKIVETAIGLALTTKQAEHVYEKSAAKTAATGYTDARDTYRETKPKVNPSVAWSDCGGFIATVMRSSGVDPDYQSVGVSAQVDYVRAHPEKYTIIENPKASDLQPGDILLSNAAGHTTMYTGAADFPVVDASYGTRVPGVRDSGSISFMLGHSAIVARFKS